MHVLFENEGLDFLSYFHLLKINCKIIRNEYQRYQFKETIRNYSRLKLRFKKSFKIINFISLIHSSIAQIVFFISK